MVPKSFLDRTQAVQDALRETTQTVSDRDRIAEAIFIQRTRRLEGLTYSHAANITELGRKHAISAYTLADAFIKEQKLRR